MMAGKVSSVEIWTGILTCWGIVNSQLCFFLDIKSKCNATSSWALAEDVSANKIVVFNVKSFSDSFAFDSKLFKYCNNVLTDQVEHTFGVGGRKYLSWSVIKAEVYLTVDFQLDHVIEICMTCKPWSFSMTDFVGWTVQNGTVILPL